MAPLEEALREKQIDLIVLIPNADLDALKESPPAVDRAFACRVIALSTSAKAQAATAYIQDMFAAH